MEQTVLVWGLRKVQVSHDHSEVDIIGSKLLDPKRGHMLDPFGIEAIFPGFQFDLVDFNTPPISPRYPACRSLN
jgi:hypothetical protein